MTSVEKILALRAKYRACLTIAEETDSKSEDKQLREDARAALESLQKLCTHAHIVQTHSYSPSYSSYEDPTNEERTCVCCGLYEVGSWTTFKTLIGDPFARFSWIRYGEGKNDDKIPAPVREPLNFLLSECVEAASGGRRV